MDHLLPALYIPIKIRNPIEGVTFPDTEVVYGYFDTGYTGFLIIPKEIYHILKLHKLKQYQYVLSLPNGEKLETRGTYGQIVLAELGFEEEGFVETTDTIKEIIIGTKALKTYRILLDFCRHASKIEGCIART